MTTRLVPIRRVCDQDLSAWRDLARRAAEPNPFCEPEFVLAADRALGQGAMLLVSETDGRWNACLPVRRLGLNGLLRAWQHPYCFLAMPLLDAGAPGPAAESLLAHTRLLVLHCQRSDGPVADAMAAALQARGLRPFFERGYERAALDRRPDGRYLEGIKVRHRRETQRQMRRLEDHLGAAPHVLDVSDDEDAPERFMAMEASGWKGREGTALASNPAHAAFFREVCAAFAGQGRLQMLELLVGDRRVAMKCNLVAGDGVFCFKIAHDEELSRFSPGVQLEIAHVERFHEDRTELWADSCADPDNAMINRLWPDRRPVVSYAVARGAASATLLSYAARTFNELRSRERTKPSPTSSTSTQTSSSPASAARRSASPTS